MSGLTSIWTRTIIRGGHGHGRLLAAALTAAPPSDSSSRPLSCHRATVTKVRRDTHVRTYPTVLVLPDGATIQVRYPLPRQIVKLPIDVDSCSKEDLNRIKHLRRPRGDTTKTEEIDATYDPLKYLKKQGRRSN